MMTAPASRPLYRPDELARTFSPRSIAVVGVSTNPAAFGSITYANIAGPGRFAGPVYMVNAKYERIGEQRCYPSIAALPETPDCVFIAVPRDAVEGIVTECAERGVGGVVLFSSGFGETGQPERVAQQQRLVAIARRANMRLVGPNCVGFMNYGLGVVGTFGTASFKGAPRPGAIGLVSQSGAVGAALAQAQEHGTALSHMLTCGNASDIDVADQVAYLAADPACKAVACVFEGMSDPARFLTAAALCHEAGKPLVVHKLGTSERGAQAAVSHTGSVAGSQAAYRAAFEQAGVIMVDELEALLDTCTFFAKAPPPQARGVAVAAVSGGACIMLADKAELHGVELPHPTPATMAVLERLIPEYGAPGNPCDMTAQVLSTPKDLHDCFEALMADPQYGALVVPHTFAYAPATARIETLGKAAAEHGKIACNVWMTQHLEGPGAIESEQNPHVATFRSMNHCMAALGAWHKRSDWLREHARAEGRVAPAQARERAAALLAASPNATLTEREGKEVLAAYGVPVVRDVLTQSADEAAAAARELGFPVVLKVESPDIPHKTEAGVIRLGVKTEEEVRKAFDEVMRNAQAVSPPARISGVLVQPMVPQGTEIMVGARVDPQFGPMVVVGLGGIFVELLKDTSVRLAPVGPREARRMLGELKAQRALQGFRGTEPVDLERLAEAIARISELAADQREHIAELDVNPLICAGTRIIAVDALIAKQKA
ncbi:MAG TPA: acetate--CoA ligase family protein [Ramlibacter sp.]|uniref:acetate--CoA ligase family protein n=1 Tax=Ramlibacter sp. TaxID=1917967 RepID=UPI002D7ED6BD|nr:acetate--CoA ligase family protein [Ramlibacter sp.]HET8746641.1 acetate--CoA ligase family protein [Ramlibacter sp.]